MLNNGDASVINGKTATINTKASMTNTKVKHPLPPISAEERHHLIKEEAYLSACERGFSGGEELADWLKAERKIDENTTPQNARILL
jgi:hypothetical protein